MVVAIVGRGQFVLGVRRICSGSRSFVLKDFRLLFPVALVAHSDKLLEQLEGSQLTNPGHLILETFGETLVILVGQSHVVPPGTVGVTVELDGVMTCLGRVLVPQHLSALVASATASHRPKFFWRSAMKSK
jgi:hypothetical protein